MKTYAITEELFPPESVAMDSPKLRWLKAHGVVTLYFDEQHRFGDEDKWAAMLAPGAHGKDAIAQAMCDEVNRNGDNRIGQGATEDEAIEDMIMKTGIPHWSLSK